MVKNMGLFSNLFNKNKTQEIEVIETVVDDSDEIAAVIAAALASMDEEEEIVAAITAAISMVIGKGTNDFVVKSIRRTFEYDSAWSISGRMKLMR